MGNDSSKKTFFNEVNKDVKALLEKYRDDDDGKPEIDTLRAKWKEELKPIRYHFGNG